MPDFFDLVLLDVREIQRSSGVLENDSAQDPRQRISFLIGPPTYLSPTCADEVIARDAVPDWVQGPGVLHVA